ncbi:hypothetical protein INR49_019695, partial [Caranx melampygus]
MGDLDSRPCLSVNQLKVDVFSATQHHSSFPSSRCLLFSGASSSSYIHHPHPPPALRFPAPSTPTVSAPPLMTQAPPLILTQTAGGTFLLPAAPGTGNAQPILLTTQGFPVQTVVNRGAPLVLNLQPGQTVQPLTLIQSSLGQLVRPSVGVSPVLPQGQAVRTRPGPDPSGGPAQPGSAFTAMQLPATLTIRTSTPGPVNLQMTQVGGASSLKLAGSPALPSGSANGVTRVTTLSSSLSNSWPHPSVVTTASAVAAAPDPPRVVMSVEEFYYGTFEGDLKLRMPHPLGIQISTFTCQICSHLAENNLRFMQHMLQHSDLIGGGAAEDRKCCRFCYRQFSSRLSCTPTRRRCTAPPPPPWTGVKFTCVCVSGMCRICEWAFDNEPAFLNHMKSNHKPGEMPYVCSYRSSFYSDVLQHFASFHRDSRFLLCVFCLKINQAFHCNRCRLQFIFLKDKMQHKLENHRSFRRPAQLEGLPPGSKVTIRTYGKHRSPMTSAVGGSSRPLLPRPANCHKDGTTEEDPPPPKTPALPPRGLSPAESRSSSGRDHFLCLECGTDASNFSAHYPTHVRCLLCPYSSCCSRAYAAHMIQTRSMSNRTRSDRTRYMSNRTRSMSNRTRSMSNRARSMSTEPDLTEPAYIEPDVQFYQDDEQHSSEEKEPGQNKDLPDRPGGRQGAGSDAIDFFNLLFPVALVELITNETNAHAKTCSSWAPPTQTGHYDNSYTFYRAMSFKRFKQIAANIRMGSLTTDEYRGTSNPSDHCTSSGRCWTSLEEEGCHAKGKPKTQPQVWRSATPSQATATASSSKWGSRSAGAWLHCSSRADEGSGRQTPPALPGQLAHLCPVMQKLLDQGIYASSSFPPQSPSCPESCGARVGWRSLATSSRGSLVHCWLPAGEDAKEMGCLSTNAAPSEPDTVWRRSQTKVGGLDPIDRPMAFRLLQENMRGVDICKQLLACNPLGGVPQDRHWRNLFWFLVNLSIVNAFIVNFRKRLGNQLAKCAQKYFETMEIASSRGMRAEAAEEPVKQRHRMVKISSISKRCKNCNMKSIRHESVIDEGWILKDRMSGTIEVNEVEENMTRRWRPITMFALCDGLRQASRVFSTETHLIWAGMKEARKRLRQTEQEHQVHAPVGVRTIGRAATLTRTLPSLPGGQSQVLQGSRTSLGAQRPLNSGSLPLVTVYLTALADGTMLPSMVLANRQLAEKALPEFIVLEAAQRVFWWKRPWTSGPTRSGCSTSSGGLCKAGPPALPAVALGQVHCWKLTLLEEASPQRLQANVAQLGDWVVEALTHLKQTPQVWKKSFRLTGLLLKEEEDEETNQKPEGDGEDTKIKQEGKEVEIKEATLEDKEETEKEDERRPKGERRGGLEDMEKDKTDEVKKTEED